MGDLIKKAGKRTKHPLAPTIRYAFLKALELHGAKRNLSFPEMMAELIEEEGLLVVMDRVSKFKEVTANVSGKVQHDHKHKHSHEGVSDSAAFLAGVLGDGESGSLEVPGEDRPILPH